MVSFWVQVLLVSIRFDSLSLKKFVNFLVKESNKLDTSWLLLRSQTNSLSFCRVVLIDPDQHFCRFCRHLLTLIHPCDDSVEWNRPWYAHESTLSNKIDPDMLMCQHCRNKSPVHTCFTIEQNVCRSVEL